jgi:hypothetical protein
MFVIIARSWFLSVHITLFFCTELGQIQGRGHDQSHMRGSQRSLTRGGATLGLPACRHTRILTKFQGEIPVFLRNMSCPYSGLNSKPGVKQVATWATYSLECWSTVSRTHKHISQRLELLFTTLHQRPQKCTPISYFELHVFLTFSLICIIVLWLNYLRVHFEDHSYWRKSRNVWLQIVWSLLHM